jgi:hypothetical protein
MDYNQGERRTIRGKKERWVWLVQIGTWVRRVMDLKGGEGDMWLIRDIYRLRMVLSGALQRIYMENRLYNHLKTA